jgi:hypothetical protein
VVLASSSGNTFGVGESEPRKQANMENRTEKLDGFTLYTGSDAQEVCRAALAVLKQSPSPEPTHNAICSVLNSEGIEVCVVYDGGTMPRILQIDEPDGKRFKVRVKDESFWARRGADGRLTAGNDLITAPINNGDELELVNPSDLSYLIPLVRKRQKVSRRKKA